ncbi:FHIPEP family type III secretion protein [Actinoplanes sp. NPDC000266]
MPFDWNDPRNQRLFHLVQDAYGGADGVDRLVLLAKLAGLPTHGMVLRSVELAVSSLLEAAAQSGRLDHLVRMAAQQNPGLAGELLTAPAPAPAPAPPAAAEAARPRFPVIVAVESADQPLADADLLRTERHLTVTLAAGRLAAIRRAVAAVSGPGADPSLDDLVRAGAEVWAEMTTAEPRLRTVLERVAEAGPDQPVAWCGHGPLLAELHPAILVAHTGEQFVTVAAGGHYFMPAGAGRDRGLPGRPHQGPPSVGEDAAARPEILLTGDLAPAGMDGVTRAVVAFGAAPAAVGALLDRVPFVSLAPDDLAAGDTAALTGALREQAGRRALPCVVAAVRNDLVRRAFEARDARGGRRALLWSSWSWVGLPLFPAGYDEVERAAYPHLMDLRSVASEGWYFNRREGIPDEYAGDELAARTTPAERFHLYLSGAGGTGKSCFLRYVHDQIALQPHRIAVWYRVDAPSSSWDNIEDRVREETVSAVAARFGTAAAAELAAIPAAVKLGAFLAGAVTVLRAADPGFDEIAVFIDQLERTFESGDRPQPARLATISRDLIQLLRTVGTGEGVRVFVASRKQYLPDFLGSSRTAGACGLEFNVLQSIKDRDERIDFVDRVVTWCRDEQLVSSGLTLDRDAAERLALLADGHPLNTMLSLIQLLSARPHGEIGPAELDELRPWENLFALDLRAAARDDLDWHVLLAMAHARTEIVRIEEVWWRLRMVDAQLTRRADELGPDGVLERLWLFGFVGRTLHVRPYAGHPARFVEFFHANLRDHLLRNVMARIGADPEIRRRRTGTPPAWRALDRLAAYAREWDQTHQLLPAEDVRVLMESREQVLERTTRWDPKTAPYFHLLFLREADNDSRERLCHAAMECFVLSALVHEDLGRQTFRELFKDVGRRVELCVQWMDRASSETRPAVLAYLVETVTPKARSVLTGLVLDGQDAGAATIRQQVAALAAEPLYAAEYRGGLVEAVLREALVRAQGDTGRLPGRAVDFVLTACGSERGVLTRLLDRAAETLSGDTDQQVRRGAPDLRRPELAEGWLRDAAPETRLAGRRVVERAALPAGAVLALVVAGDLRAQTGEDRLADWTRGLRARLGIRVPRLRLIAGECRPGEMELRSPRFRMATNLFRPGQVCVDQRRWRQFTSRGGHTALDSSDLTGRGGVLWLAPEDVARAGYPYRVRAFDEAVVDWLEECCRRSFGMLLTDDMLNRVRLDAAAATGSARVRPVNPSALAQVLVDLVEEEVPLDAARLSAVIEHLVWLADKQPGRRLTQKVRELLSTEICAQVADDAGQVTTLLLEEQLEQTLADRVVPQERDTALAVSRGEATALNNEVVRAREKAENESARPVVLVTDPALRYALARLLWQFDTRLPVLGYTELDLGALFPVAGGLVNLALPRAGGGR